jgi:hypothetical protein
VIPGAEHSLTQEWNRGVVEAIDGFMHLRR